MKYQMKLWKKIVLMLLLLGAVFGIWMFAPSGTGQNIDRKKIASSDDLSGATIGVQLGTTAEVLLSDLEADGSGTKVERYNKGNDAVEALKQGKIDCFVFDEEPVKEYIKRNPQLVMLEEPYAVEDYSILMAKGNTELRDKVDNALTKLMEDGTLDQIRAYYIDNEDGMKPRYVQKKDVDRSNGTLRMATNVTFPPYEYYQGGEPVGIDVDLAYAICDQLGMTLEINDMDFGAIINAVNAGKADVGISGFTRTEDREKNVEFTQNYARSSQVILTMSDDAIEAEQPQTFADKFYDNFIRDDRYQFILNGLGNTLLIALFAVLVGAILGFLIAVVRATYEKTGHFEILDWFFRVYVTVFRGTPVVVQLLIIYFVIFASSNVSKVLVAVIVFGMNSSAYVSEIIRSGIMSIDQGQFEAGRSLGLTHHQTMWHIILPQAIKNVLPALGNEFIVLLKETSVCGFIGLTDLTRGGEIIRGTTYEAFLPLFAVAMIYLILVMLLSAGIAKMEQKLRKSER